VTLEFFLHFISNNQGQTMEINSKGKTYSIMKKETFQRV